MLHDWTDSQILEGDGAGCGVKSEKKGPEVGTETQSKHVATLKAMTPETQRYLWKIHPQMENEA